MAGGKLDLWQAGTLAKGVNVNSPDFQVDIELTAATVNATSGIFQGIGPRFGMAPIPGQSDNETPGTGQCPGIMRANLTGFGMSNNAETPNTWTLSKVFAIYPIRIGGAGSAANLAAINTYYLAVIGYTTNVQSGLYVDTVLLSTVTSNVYVQSSAIYAGLASTGVDNINFAITAGETVLWLTGEFTQNTASKVTTVLNLTKLPSTSTNFVSSSFFSVPGVEVPMQWMAGMVSAGGSSTQPSTISLYRVALSSPGNCISGGGIPPSFNRQNFPMTPRTATEWAIKANGDWNNIGWTVKGTASTHIYEPMYIDYDPTDALFNIDWFDNGGTQFGSGSSYTNNKVGLYNDPVITCNSAYQGTLIASGAGGFAILIQDWYQNQYGSMPQYVDLTSSPLAPPNFNATYTEDGGPTPACFYAWPVFVRGTALSSANGVALGGANSGVLRANTTYEFTYSIFNKRLNCETNVGSPVKIQTGTNDFIGLQLFTSTFNGGGVILTPAALRNTNDEGILPWPGIGSFTSVGGSFHINYLEYRFYYRPEGSQSWLPALFVDAAQYWFYPSWTPMMACTGAIGGLPGGEPGGFQDYSPLPADTYDCVVMYKSRAFWFSSKSVVFSLLSNVFAYAGRNTASCPTGSFHGALVQAYYGQADQDARLVVFGTDATYVGKFTGQQQEVPVTVSAASGPINFALDGTDFILNIWTSITAFSYRSAVVAEGILYFWGPQGVFKDDGVNPLARISIPLEPTIFGLYDPSQTLNISCTYNQTTKEVYWFYPSTTSTVSQVLIWNTVANTWLFGQMRGQVDAAQQLKVDTAIPTAGSRTLLLGRASSSGSSQRAYFFDQNNLACDMFPGSELMVKSISTPSAGLRRLTLAAGDSVLTGVAAGDVIALQQCAAYANGALSTPSDFMAVVAAVNSGARTLDITLPTGATLDASATIGSNNQFFPIWHAAGTKGIISGIGLNAFAYNIDTKFWIPSGMSYWAYWLYMHLVFKLYAFLPGPAPTVAFSYATPISGTNIQTDTLTFVNNSANNFQVLHSNAPGQSNFEGQGLKMTFSGIQLANSWILQFVEAYAQMKDGMQLKTFEGLWLAAILGAKFLLPFLGSHLT